MKRLIVFDPEILGGSPVFIGTRLPVRVLFEDLELLMGGVEPRFIGPLLAPVFEALDCRSMKS